MDGTAQPGWWKRHWKWFVPVSCLTVLMAYAFVNGASRLDAVYTEASSRATHNPKVIAVLGEPIQANFETSTVNGSSTSARINGIEVPHRGTDDKIVFKMQLIGPKGEATLSARATPSFVGWDFQQLAIETRDNPQQIDLLHDHVL